MPSATFQQGSTYTGTIDTTLQQAKPDVGGGSWLNLFVDGGSGAQQQGLLEFTNLFGSGPGQIPVGAIITSATLTLSVADGTTKGGGIYQMTTGWDSNSTWNSLVGGVQIGVETATNPVLSLGKVATGTQAYDVTSSLQSWLSGATTASQANAANEGWLFNSTSTDGWKFSSSEGSTAPVLTVTYTLPGAQIALGGPVSLNEGTSASPTAFTFTVNRTGDTSGTSSVNYAVTGSGANAADAGDFASGILPTGTVTFAPGQTSQTITVNVVGDSVLESNEGFTLTLSNPSSGATITGATSTGTILNDDLPPQLAMHGPVSLNEGTSAGSTAFTFTVDRTGDTSGTVSVDYGVTGSGANPADAIDFASGVLPSGTVTFAPGQTSQTITVNVAADSAFESNEGFTLTLSNATGGASITGATTTGTILNDDSAPPPQLALQGPVSGNEGSAGGSTAFVFTVNRTGDTTTAATVDYAVGGTGANPADASDFSGGILPTGTVSFAAGQTSQTITINVAADSNFESDEGFLLTLSNPTGGAQITGATATGTIVNDDTAPTGPVTVTFQQGGTYTGTLDTSVKENQPNTDNGNATSMYVDAGTGVREQTLLEFGNLFGSGPGQIPVGATITSATLTLNVTNASGNGGGIYRMTAGWDESSTWNSLGNGVQIGTESLGTADVTLGKVATGLQSYNVTSSLQAWLSGATTATQANAANLGWLFNTNSTDAWVFSSSESSVAPKLVVTYTPAGYTPPGSALALAGPVSANEGTSENPTSFVFTVNRTGDTSVATSVNYSVSGSGANGATFSDFSSGLLPSGTVNFAAGETSKTITINVVGDTSVESNENFTVTLSNATNGATITGATATGTILNDDLNNGFRGINIIDGSTYGDGTQNGPGHWGSTDPTDIAVAADGTFYLVDSEVDETPLFGSVNMWHLDSTGHLIAPVSIESFTDEPTGIAAWASGGKQYLFISDDNAQKIYKVDAANPTVVLSSISTTSFGAVDPEDICINPNNGNIFVMSENDHKIYEITQSGTKVATTTLPATFVPHTDPLAEDAGAEAIAYDPVKDVFWVTGGFSPDIFEVSRSGQILNVINVLESYPNPSLVNTPQGVYLKGIEFAPSSDGSGHLSLWVTDYGRDQYPDGRLIEIMLNDTVGQSSTTTTTTTTTTTMAAAASNLALHDAVVAVEPAADRHASVLAGQEFKAWIGSGHGPMGVQVHDTLHEWGGLHNDFSHLF